MAAWAGVATPAAFGVTVAAVALAVFVAGVRRKPLLLVGIVAAVAACLGHAAQVRASTTRTAAVPDGRVSMRAVAVTDPLGLPAPVILAVPQEVDQGGQWVRWRGPVLAVADAPPEVMAGELLEVVGVIDPTRDTYRGRAIAGMIDARTVRRVGPATNPLLAVGNALRRRVLGGLALATQRPSGALLAGFLIGDVSQLPERDQDALRAAGLSHFVAVSGSNVALFLAAWWIAGGPLRLGPRARSAFGLIGIAVFAVVTRWEPSVVRASVMAALVLVGRGIGRPITPLTALGGAIALSLLAAPELAGSVGFSLSVAATVGIILGVGLWEDRRPRWVWAVLGATIAAQAAVAPLLLMWFGKVPLLAPLTNLAAAPMVAASTAIGGVGTLLQLDGLVRIGTMVASGVLGIARTASDLPQLNAVQTLGVAGGVALAIRFSFLRPLGFTLVPLVVLLAIVPVRTPGVAEVHFLDVGQGDATLFVGRQGQTILVDGGPDPGRLRQHLADFGVRRIDLLVISHSHADHTTGLIGLADETSVGMVWYPEPVEEAPVLDGVVAELRKAGTVVTMPRRGDSVLLGDLTVTVLGPARRYASSNDASLVLLVDWRGVGVLMAGDIETFAQRDLGPFRADVLKVPHQGAATSDLEWLRDSAPAVAVISVGENDYGHPSDAVIETLQQAGAIVYRTDQHGTVTVPLDRVTG